MPRFNVAHLREQGQDIIIVPLESNFGSKSIGDQQGITADIQRHANGAGLRGTVVPVWDNGGGRMGYIAPRPWHPFFSGINMSFVAANVNREISW
jgi:hypothetical protein